MSRLLLFNRFYVGLHYSDLIIVLFKVPKEAFYRLGHNDKVNLVSVKTKSKLILSTIFYSFFIEGVSLF